MYILVLLIWILFSFLIASLASKKGRSGIAFFFLALLTSPILSLIILGVAGDSSHLIRKRENEQRAKEDRRRASTKRQEIIEEENSSNSSSVYENLGKIGDLLEKGVLTKDEFDLEKQKILGQQNTQETVTEQKKMLTQDFLTN